MAGFKKALYVLLALFVIGENVNEVAALQIMIKNTNWYCFGFQADMKTILDIDYMITGVNPEDVSFEAVQGGK